MLNNNTLIFRILYFITSMSPAYILMAVKYVDLNWLADRLHCPLLSNIYLSKLIAMSACAIICFLLAYFFKKKLDDIGGQRVSISYHHLNINTKNGDMVSFLIGIILPTFINIDDSWFINILLFILLQLLIYKLMTKSSFIFPNILLILIGYSLIQIDNRWILLKEQFLNKDGKAKLVCIDRENSIFVMEDLDEDI